MSTTVVMRVRGSLFVPKDKRPLPIAQDVLDIVCGKYKCELLHGPGSCTIGTDYACRLTFPEGAPVPELPIQFVMPGTEKLVMILALNANGSEPLFPDYNDETDDDGSRSEGDGIEYDSDGNPIEEECHSDE